MKIINNLEPVIGIETHVRILSNSKIFSNSISKFSNIPNNNINYIDLAFPGTLPNFNKNLINKIIKLSLIVNGKINLKSFFYRKNYFYPDLPKGYQITQFKKQIIKNGFLNFFYKKKNIIKEKRVNLSHIHIEEDAAKLIHDKKNTYIDFNRVSTPLLEIVTKPEIKNSTIAVNYLKYLNNLLILFKIYNGKIEEGNFRSDINISIKNKDTNKLGIRCEIKNLNSFKYIKDSINYEIKRQLNIIKKGGNILSETLKYNKKKKITISLRNKEIDLDYRYIIEPDLPPIIIKKKLIKKIKKKIKKTPYQIYKKYILKYKFSKIQSYLLIKNKNILKYFNKVLIFTNFKYHKIIVKWIIKYLINLLNKNSINIKNSYINPKNFSKFIKLIIKKKNVNKKLIFLEMWKNNGKIKVKKIKNIKEKKIYIKIKKIFLKNINLIKDYKNGNKKIINFLMKKLIKNTNNNYNNSKLYKILKNKLNGKYYKLSK
ncbi:putative glutamyl-tRNA(Gln) amidotransferase, B subunit [Candidatus Zinderia insecticola CARI]|uniref:Aspartyl/glutamyl-tRNA(Asn/Gln) amidotransferase subunit B n=1 Tax=Zinderia insecticola (strain CARI) TaxID=871271 RepID=E0TIZ6_ZINIC|nr:putative glutamyl-tRNA(Gln) amidotransferase, B subunit [Candidatus Zinderia insecticola CARI]